MQSGTRCFNSGLFQTLAIIPIIHDHFGDHVQLRFNRGGFSFGSFKLRSVTFDSSTLFVLCIPKYYCPDNKRYATQIWVSLAVTAYLRASSLFKDEA